MKRPLQFTITFTILLTAPIYSPLSWALPIDDFRSESLLVLGNDSNEPVGVSRPHFTSRLALVAEMRSVRLEDTSRSNQTVAILPPFSSNTTVVGAAAERNPLDVNADGLVTALDSALITNYLNERQYTKTKADESAFDANRDGAISPMDVLTVINCLNGPDGCFDVNGIVPSPEIQKDPAVILVQNGRAASKLSVSYSFKSLNLLMGGADAFSIPFKMAGESIPFEKTILEITIASDKGKKLSRCEAKLARPEWKDHVQPFESVMLVRFSECKGTANLANVDTLSVTMLASEGGAIDYRLFGIATNGRTISSPEDVVSSSIPSLPPYVHQPPCQSDCGCDPLIENLGCGCGNPGPSGCDHLCGSLKTVDSCGVCGGVGESCTQAKECDFYTLSKVKEMQDLQSLYDEMVRWDAKNRNSQTWRMFEGEGAKLACLDQLVQEQISICKKTQPAQSCVSTKEDGYWMNRTGWLGDGGDDVLMDTLFMDKAALDAARRVSTWTSAYYTCRANLENSSCNYFKTLAQPYKLRGRYISKNCKIVDQVDPGKLCGDLTLNMTLSPISIQFDELAETKAHVVRFRMNPHAAESWVHWRGSAAFPLLAIDNNHNGEVDDGSELFGNWTFGGKHAASLNEVLSNGPWRDGFEVLATMDTNIDGVISETELASLQVWSDENSNAVTDPGELENASDFGLSEIKLQVPRTSPYSRDLISSKAASLVRNDTHRQATLVDWFTPSFFTSMEAISNQPLFRSGPIHSGPIQKDTERVQLNYGASPPTLSDSIGAPDISGIWSWQVQGTDSQDRNSRGFFWIAQNSTAIHGFSIGEIPVVSKSQQTFGSFASPAFLFGVIGSKAFEPQIDFMVSTNDSFLFSEASFDATSGTLHGTTQTTSNANLGAGSIQYSWTAQRVSPTN